MKLPLFGLAPTWADSFNSSRTYYGGLMFRLSGLDGGPAGVPTTGGPKDEKVAHLDTCLFGVELLGR